MEQAAAYVYREYGAYINKNEWVWPIAAMAMILAKERNEPISGAVAWIVNEIDWLKHNRHRLKVSEDGRALLDENKKSVLEWTREDAL